MTEKEIGLDMRQGTWVKPMNGGELYKLTRERRESEDQILDSVRESVLADLEGLASEARQFVQQFEARMAAIVARARGLVDSGDKLEAGGRLPQGSTLADMHELDRQLNAIIDGGRTQPLDAVETALAYEREKSERDRMLRPEIIAVRDGRD